MRTTHDLAARFSSLYRETYPDVLRYTKRRSPHPDDVAAETFTTAWRRVADLPVDLDDARAWLFGIARNMILNDRRSAQRSTALGIRLDTHPQPSPGDDSELTVLRVDLARAWAHLSAEDQEVIALTVLDGLDATHAASVLGITAVAYRHRLSRARRRLRAHAETPATSPRTAPTLSLACPQES